MEKPKQGKLDKRIRRISFEDESYRKKKSVIQ